MLAKRTRFGTAMKCEISSVALTGRSELLNWYSLENINYSLTNTRDIPLDK